MRLSRSFFMRNFLHSEVSNFCGIPNIPDDPDLAIAAGRNLCEHLLQPLYDTFGGIEIRSAFRSATLNDFCYTHGHYCAPNEENYARHIWDRRDAEGCMGATACIVIPWFLPRYEKTSDWRALAWWIHDRLPYSELQFFRRLAAFNITWRERPKRVIEGFTRPRGILTRPGMPNHEGRHASEYRGFPRLKRIR